MSIVLATTIHIDATPEEVWEVLSDFSTYGEWSNFSRIDGAPVVGTKLSMRMPGFRFTSAVTAADTNQRLQWSATIITAGLFLGEHRFTLVRREDGTTQLDNTETFSGALTKPFEVFFAKNQNDGGYAAFNRGLKSRVEARSARTSRKLHVV